MAEGTFGTGGHIFFQFVREKYRQVIIVRYHPCMVYIDAILYY